MKVLHGLIVLEWSFRIEAELSLFGYTTEGDGHALPLPLPSPVAKAGELMASILLWCSSIVQFSHGSHCATHAVMDGPIRSLKRWIQPQDGVTTM